ncbi:MAG: hypothetical protein QF609_04585 [Gammaproteobacteria bacterium]|nr:hypothetical protein [Gammaproteobacteria bacterium]HJP36335.1 hypothetical protein [Gammaproteobacteria bacterium]
MEIGIARLFQRRDHDDIAEAQIRGWLQPMHGRFEARRKAIGDYDLAQVTRNAGVALDRPRNDVHPARSRWNTAGPGGSSTARPVR